MVVDDLDVVGVARFPAEADPPLIVDSYGVLASPPSLQSLSSKPRRFKVFERTNLTQ
jgi:hypothetical protein